MYLSHCLSFHKRQQIQTSSEKNHVQEVVVTMMSSFFVLMIGVVYSVTETWVFSHALFQIQQPTWHNKNSCRYLHRSCLHVGSSSPERTTSQVVYKRRRVGDTNDTDSNISKIIKLHTTRYCSVKALIPKNGSVAFAVDRLESNLIFGKMSSRDRSFCRLLVTTTERRLGQIDSIIDSFRNQKNGKPDQQRKIVRRLNRRVDQLVQATLRVGTAQLLFLDVPSHAAIKESIDVLRMDKDIRVPESLIKFVNAVLRRIDREGRCLLENNDNNLLFSVSRNASPWLVDEWKAAWGKEATEKILSAAMKESPRCLTINQRVRPNLSPSGFKIEMFQSTNGGGKLRIEQKKIEAVAKLFDGAEILPQGSVVVHNPPSGTISSWPLYEEGEWWCQDPSATIPAQALYNALSQNSVLSVDDRNVIDLCAAPGGKTAQLSNYGFASVTAVEISSKRSERLLQNMRRLKFNWRIVIADGTKWSPKETVDAVLLDVPCTATGTGSKRPDVLRRDENISALLETQFNLACHAADEMLSIGGVLVYATCSLLKQESEDQVTKLLKRERGSKLKTIRFQPGEIPGFDECIDANGWIRVLPGQLQGSLSQADGFFVARLEKISI